MPSIAQFYAAQQKGRITKQRHWHTLHIHICITQTHERHRNDRKSKWNERRAYVCMHIADARIQTTDTGASSIILERERERASNTRSKSNHEIIHQKYVEISNKSEYFEFKSKRFYRFVFAFVLRFTHLPVASTHR